MQIVGRTHDLVLRPLSEVPRHIIRQATKESVLWDVLSWGMVDLAQLALLDRAPLRRIRRMFKAWEEDAGVTAEEVGQLLALIKKHRSELERDLIREGMRLRDFPSERYNWRDLLVMVKLPDDDSRVWAAMEPDAAGWGRVAMLVAHVADNVSWLQWSKTKDAEDGGDPPERIERPGVKNKERRKGSRVKPMLLSRVKELARGDMRETDDREAKLGRIFRK